MTRTDPHTRSTIGSPWGPEEVRHSLRRVTGLARANTLLMLRNRLTLFYALALPLFPVGLLLFGGDREDAVVLTGVATGLLMVLLFPVYYNVLSLVVTRRDELVLKRIRTGETRDAELLVSLALPGAAAAGISALVLLVAGLVAGLPVPVNPVLLLLLVLGGCVTFAALAVWTAAWTRNAEAAQMTSLPVMAVVLAGLMTDLLPQWLQPFAERTPGAAVDQLLWLGWVGRTGPDAEAAGFLGSFADGVAPLATLVAWSVLALWLARSSMRWEPRF